MEDESEQNLGDPEQRHLGPEDAVVEETGAEAAGLLVTLCHAAENHYGLRVHECDAPGAPPHWGPVHRVHSPGSYHYLHRAADISGLEGNMRRFCSWVSANYGTRLAELIHQPGCSVKDGRGVPGSFWGSAWDQHRDHVHLAI
jgi:hypothetical protein